MASLDELLHDVDARFERLQAEARIPGVAWGVLIGGELRHAGGAGTIRDGEDVRPDAASVFRIASMTKSFTAAALLLLRDEGRVRLDEPVATYVPKLASWRPPTTDSPPITVRHLMTMSAGLPTDDPWGDRQQSLDLDAFAALLGAGPTFAWPPGTTFEYSNLGYGILGRVVTNVAGREYRDVVRDRLLRPLGMTASAYDEEDVPAERLAHGYVRRGEELVREGRDAYGALAAMGGLYSSVADLARWMAGFLDAFPARDDPEGPHPLRRASRREMQQVQRATDLYLAELPADAVAPMAAGGYGLGLVTVRDLEIGTIVGHAGGYPGFGSHMTWHPASGIGVVALGNLRYAQVRVPAGEQLRALVRADAAPRRRVVAGPAVEAFRPALESLLTAWDDAVADRTFAMNLDLDEPREARRDRVRAAAESVGLPLRQDPSRRAESDSPADVAWWLRGARGWLRVSILVTPEPRPRVQTFDVTSVGDPSPRLREVAERLLIVAADRAAGWPADLATAPELDRDAAVRSLHAISIRFGPPALGLPRDGDGRSTTTFALETERGRCDLRVGVDPETGVVTAAVGLVRERLPPPEPW